MELLVQVWMDLDAVCSNGGRIRTATLTATARFRGLGEGTGEVRPSIDPDVVFGDSGERGPPGDWGTWPDTGTGTGELGVDAPLRLILLRHYLTLRSRREFSSNKEQM